ncbi:hypothetical protein [Streptomyces sp. NPDC059460]
MTTTEGEHGTAVEVVYAELVDDAETPTAGTVAEYDPATEVLAGRCHVG